MSEAIVATLNGGDEKALTEQARAIAGLMPKGAPKAPEAGAFPRDSGPEDSSSNDWLRDVLNGKN